MKREPDFFGEQELTLVYIAKRLKDALKLEELLTAAGVDYAVEPDEYSGGLIFRTRRVGAFFYVLPEAEEAARRVMSAQGYKPQNVAGE